MPFRSKKQWRAAYAGKIPGVDPHEWAHETPSFKKLPERAPAEKGKPTLRSKKANGDMLQYFADHPDKYRARVERKERERKRRGKTAALFAEAADFTPELEALLVDVFKLAALGSAAVKPSSVGRLKGMMTNNAMKTPGYAASTQAMNPRRNVIRAMNVSKPH